ncbi:translesion DNA synthesis-associated protein ImuA [Jeongeupia naejangsanensis]|uniref:Translesion DNA synthesis-associated protein ImuA n=1 Tax=Jeongeupia naejangsanensis TaxID=613195 RepID=A0ABS2BPS9_9NEIS|nr:translesion DNA synthesis-associated protein ImuA [Jeongeupia naejangsanensis]MBM3116794.1 translesion DNA synthesis-associated protein ImuA [Jeongeupia naejangsanensis]
MDKQNSSLGDVLKHPAIWRGDGRATVPACVPSGHPALDAVLPGGGWPLASVTEIVAARPGTGELALLWPMLRHCTGQSICLIQPPLLPYAPAWAAAGIALERLVWLRPGDAAGALWAMEQTLREPGCGAVLGWIDGVDDRAARRLLLASREGGACGFLLRTRPGQTSPLPLRLGVDALPGGVAVRVLKRRGPPLVPPIMLTETSHALAGLIPAQATAGRVSGHRNAA